MTQLRLMTEFEQALSNYHYSDAAKRVLADTKLVLLVGATASGRNTAINKLLKTGRYHFIISDTTREPRENNGVLEQDGVEYFFRTEQQMLDEIRKGEFLEAEIIHGRQVSGISMRELQIARDEGKIAITDVDIGGIQNVLKLKPDTVAILLLPPSFEEWQRRISERGEMPADVYKSRLETAERIFAAAIDEHSELLHLVLNQNIAQAVQSIDDLANGKRPTEVDTQDNWQVVAELLAATRQKLQEL